MDFKITERELGEFENFKDELENISHSLLTLCNSEKSDISYGFELGKIYVQLLHLKVKIYELETQIRDNGRNR